ncbi:MAG: tryptophan synthase subunit alpha [Euryarchaeota archaeon]|nr:tryptophan synthase subunit alpha [Euryarchaeota archaeon]OUW32778.1 MAG: tryptophan synthase subunit alpha [Actinobacteria bacterium TMED172]|tara:strand:+ start:630 stop:1394 length:765 start_codon:yes stop_codon:yes gene_type:complete
MEGFLRSRRDAGSKLLVAYITGGFEGWEAAVETAAAAGADAIEIGIPFSDPVMDGPVIQEASQRALEDGATPASVLATVPNLDTGVPHAVMTYYNLAHHPGHDRFAATLASSGIDAAILPDLPFVESGPWRQAAANVGIETIMLAAPTTPDARLGELCEASSGFVYAVGLLGVTGERAQLASTATEIAARCKGVTDKPVLTGVGIGSPEHAVEACEVADGVIIGSAVVRRLLSGDGADGVGELIASFRDALDAG